MYREDLLQRCTQLYGEDIGDKLSLAMLQIYQKDFCVATGLDSKHISISRSCLSRGRLFELSNDCKYLVMPGGFLQTIDSLTYQDLAPLLPWNSANPPGHRHCFMDDPIRSGFDMSSLI